MKCHTFTTHLSYEDLAAVQVRVVQRLDGRPRLRRRLELHEAAALGPALRVLQHVRARHWLIHVRGHVVSMCQSSEASLASPSLPIAPTTTTTSKTQPSRHTPRTLSRLLHVVLQPLPRRAPREVPHVDAAVVAAALRLRARHAPARRLARAALVRCGWVGRSVCVCWVIGVAAG